MYYALVRNLQFHAYSRLNVCLGNEITLLKYVTHALTKKVIWAIYGPKLEITWSKIWEYYGNDMAIIWPGEVHIKTFSDVAIFRKCGLNTYLDHFQILAIYGENMDKTKQYSQCCAIPRYQPYMK